MVEPTPDGSPQFFNIRVYREHFGARIHSAFAVRALTAALPVLAPGLALLAAVGVLVPHFDQTILFGVVCAVAAGFALWFGMILAVRAYDSVLLPLVVEAIETQYGLLGASRAAPTAALCPR